MKFMKQLVWAIVFGVVGSVNGYAAEKPLEVIVFPGGSDWPLWVALEKGFYAADGVTVNVTPTPSSVFQMTGLIDGKFDIALTAMDNLVAYREGQGEVPKVGEDLIAVMGGDRGFLKLVSTPQVKSVAALRGKTVSVDARGTGYAFVLYEMLDRAGLHEPDFQIERVGGVKQRFDALLEGKQQATLLVSPFELRAHADGFNILASGLDTVGAYQGMVAGVRAAWAQSNRARLEAFINAYAKGVEWLYDPANRHDAMRIYMKYAPNSNLTEAEAAYPVLVNEETGFQRRAAIEPAGIEEVLKLRDKWANPEKRMHDPSNYYDPSFYDDALKR
ncbi:ABC transporter substrate-binding protein [Paraburkholderia hospita]|uniref:ABC transporter substrate-binding protein n=1 Tax=Paraburkholderia hospita TaxID=169430 RepID=A0AAN1MQY4_9BURK|nr:ABC transporter substrate-binding protein [Paraburkholderia hospita]AUT76268.1 ABC transporter substrate-binding protein [Paraburkholderia hospita]SEI17798.1 ABC-type nitrate/sulfonate/bicarbonate transport system, substrate-binding protein [Paraburkholderia hospita]